MMLNSTLNTTLLLLAAAVSATLTVIAWRRSSGLPSGLPLAIACLGLTWWSGSYALYWAGTPAPDPLFWLKATYIGTVMVPGALLMFTLRFVYPHQVIQRRVVAALFIEPLFTLTMVATDPGGFYFGGLLQPGATAMQTGGAGFWIDTTYDYALIIIASVLLWRAFLRAEGLYRRQFGVFLLGVAVPWAANFAGVLGIQPPNAVDLTPLTFTVAGVFLAYGLFRYHLLDVVPVARHVLIENMGDGVLVLDGMNRIVDVNPAFGEISGLVPAAIIGLTPAQAMAEWPDLVARYSGVTHIEDHVELPGDPPRYIDVRIVPIYESNVLTGRLIVVRDISASKHAETKLIEANAQLEERLKEITVLQEKLREQAVRDPLTGLFNRRYLEETLTRELAQASRVGWNLSVVIIDVDYFKAINDTSGHAAGDIFLQELGALLQQNTRSGDVVSRYGGEEFVVVLPGATAEQAHQRAEEWRQQFEELRVPHEGHQLRATFSAGVATYPPHGSGSYELLRAADSAMYQAKQNGRNQVVVYGQPLPKAAPAEDFAERVA